MTKVFLFSRKQLLILIPRSLARQVVSGKARLAALPVARSSRRADIVEAEAGVEITAGEGERRRGCWVRILRRCSL